MNAIFKLCSHASRFKHIKQPSLRFLSVTSHRSKYIDEPEYIKYTKPQVPVYEPLNIQLRSYDFTVLEHYAKYVHKIALSMDMEVTNAWATPHQAFKITNNEPGTTKIANEYFLNKYERNIQIKDLPAYCATNFFEVIQSSLPMGVTVDVHPHEPKHDEIRYIPDFELLVLKEQLQELTNLDSTPVKK
ncbi:hypothetical protein JTE90_011319 [Oedothorax gibbosus]|uniref:Small ribosomal subunit protein uS10 domain-containing protein n=1 Tax=Oedothorax gibbosus TaxID=931172 RepID=A0AAV6VLR9_9ARAC|nr:hypothetical protein JTE90_011319 [Oedothorax gibbosus]